MSSNRTPSRSSNTPRLQPRALIAALAALAIALVAIAGPAGAVERGARPAPVPEPTAPIGAELGVEGREQTQPRRSETPVEVSTELGVEGRNPDPGLRSDGPGDVQLELVDAVQPSPEELPVVPIPMLPSSNPTGTLTGNEFGCAASCIGSAHLQQNMVNPDIHLVMTTFVRTTKLVWALPPGPLYVNGVPAWVGQIPVAVSPNSWAWYADLNMLAHDTTYRLVISATDNQGNTQFATKIVTTTPAPVPDLIAPGSSCYFDCIESGYVELGETFDTATVHVTANAEVDFSIAVSTSAPGTIGGNPFLPADVPMAVSHVDPTSIAMDLSDLEPDTKYYVVAKATDSEGFMHFATGDFTTPQGPSTEVWIQFQRTHIHGTGDLVGNGEIRFTYGFEEHVWWTEESSLGEGDGYTLDHGQEVSIPYGETLPTIVVNAFETDVSFDPGALLCPLGTFLYEFAQLLECGDTVSVGLMVGFPIEWIETLPLCTHFGLTGLNGERRCHVLTSNGHGNEYVDFDTLISFDIR